MNYNDYQVNNYEQRNNFHADYSFNEKDNDEVVSIGKWLLIFILTAIPYVNIVSLLVLAFGVKNKNIQNYGRAALIVLLIVIVFLIIAR